MINPSFAPKHYYSYSDDAKLWMHWKHIIGFIVIGTEIKYSHNFHREHFLNLLRIKYIEDDLANTKWWKKEENRYETVSNPKNKAEIEDVPDLNI